MNSYMKIIDLGRDQNHPCTNYDDPLRYCMQTSMDTSFNNGSIGGSFIGGPRSSNVQNYMAERCSKKFDGFCEYFYKQNQLGGTWEHNRLWPNTVNKTSNPQGSSTPQFDTFNQTIGDFFLGNTAERKYCTYLNCVPIYQPFDPTNPNSPSIVQYKDPTGQSQNCFPICRVDPKTQDLNNDPVMNRILDKPETAAPTIINICNTAKREGTDLSGTRIGAVCNNYFQALNNMKNTQNSL
jgi:hypothetical protein